MFSCMGKIVRSSGQAVTVSYVDLVKKSSPGNSLPGPPVWDGPFTLHSVFCCQGYVGFTRVLLHLSFLHFYGGDRLVRKRTSIRRIFKLPHALHTKMDSFFSFTVGTGNLEP